MEEIKLNSGKEGDRETKSHRPFEIVEYDPNWIWEFEMHKLKLTEILGDETLDIQHIGSTAIPGMVAKPQIDILVVVKDVDRIKSKYGAMLAAGFEHRGDYTGIGEEYFTEDDQEGRRLTSIHVLPRGHPEIEELMDFRDFLIADEDARELYITAKRELFASHRGDYSAYDAGKQQIIETIRQRVEEWKSKIPGSRPQ